MSASTETRQRIAVVIYEDATKDLAKAYRGLMTATEFLDAGDDVTVVYDGSGVDTLAAASTEDHQLHRIVEKLRPNTLGACGFCAKAHGVIEPITAANWTLLGDHKGHASIRRLVVEGYQVITF
ncbi:MAG: sulfur reduction protein DsrE [Actinomycetota bacterium]